MSNLFEAIAFVLIQRKSVKWLMTWWPIKKNDERWGVCEGLGSGVLITDDWTWKKTREVLYTTPLSIVECGTDQQCTIGGNAMRDAPI